jgi:hypothetical protein
MGHQACAVLAEDFFRLQAGRGREARPPETEVDTGWGDWQTGPFPPEPAEAVNDGRKVITFADGRQHAARFAGDLAYSHRRDVFRQLMLQSLAEHGEEAVSSRELHNDLSRLCVDRAIDPLDKRDGGGDINYWQERRINPPEAARLANDALWSVIRREITDRQLGLEALGLARWMPAPGGDVRHLIDVPALRHFGQEDSVKVLMSVVRILAAEDLVLPENGDPYYWTQIPGGGRASRVAVLQSRDGAFRCRVKTGRCAA